MKLFDGGQYLLYKYSDQKDNDCLDLEINRQLIFALVYTCKVCSVLFKDESGLLVIIKLEVHIVLMLEDNMKQRKSNRKWCDGNASDHTDNN